MIYLDSSALVKLLVREDGSEAVKSCLEATGYGDGLVTSKLTGVELARFAVREGLPRTHVDEIMDRLDEVDCTDEVLRAAKDIPHHTKSLDAIHLGTAVLLNVEFLATFDQNMADVAGKIGLRAGRPRSSR